MVNSESKEISNGYNKCFVNNTVTKYEQSFFASLIFRKQLSVLNANKNQNETIYDLYPKLLEWYAERGAKEK